MNACIFCLEIGDTFKLTGPCECRPTVDMKCLEEWQKSKADTCPICLVSYVISNNRRGQEDFIISERRITDNKYYILFTIGCLGIVMVIIGVILYEIIT